MRNIKRTIAKDLTLASIFKDDSAKIWNTQAPNKTCP